MDVAVDPLSTLSDCRIVDLRTGAASAAKVLRFNMGGVSLFTNAPLKTGSHLRVTLFDDKSFSAITILVQVRGRMFRVREWLGFGKKSNSRGAYFAGAGKPKEYHCALCNSGSLPREYAALYERAVERDATLRREEPAWRRIVEPPIEFRIAVTAAEKEAAYRLAYRERAKRGRISRQSSEMCAPPQVLVPGTRTIIGVRRGEVLLTMTVFADSDLGLPAENISRSAFAERSLGGAKPVEFGLLAWNETFFESPWLVGARRRRIALTSLFCFAAQYAVFELNARWAVASADDADHGIFSHFGFGAVREDVAPVRDSMRPMKLNLIRASALLGSRKAEEKLSADAYFTMRDLFYLFVEQSDIAKNLTAEQRQVLAGLSPHLAAWFQSLPTILLYA